MIRNFLIFFFSFIFTNSVYSKENSFYPDDLFHIDHMDSHNKEFALYFKGREKSILARGEESNYINDFPRDLYIYNYSTKSSMPLISYDWFPSQAKYFLQEYNFPVFPDDFAYYLLKDNKTFVIGVEGSEDSGWVLIDCGQIVINIMKKEERDFYDLEGLWGENSFIEQSS